MKREELEKKLGDLEKEYYTKKRYLYSLFAQSNNPCKVGDIIKDRIGLGEITSMQLFVSFNDEVCMKYNCKEVKKDGTLKRKSNGEISFREIYQSNVIEINKEPYKYNYDGI
jgi:hypothetical protein